MRHTKVVDTYFILASVREHSDLCFCLTLTYPIDHICLTLLFRREMAHLRYSASSLHSPSLI